MFFGAFRTRWIINSICSVEISTVSSVSAEHHSRTRDPKHLLCSSGSRGSLHICLYHQRSQVQSPLLPRLHCFWCGEYCNYRLTGVNNPSVITFSRHFLPLNQNLAYEIILTLGQAFEVAYQLALQARKSGHGSSTLPESFDSKPSKPVPKPRVNIRKSVSPATIVLSEGKLHLLLFSIAVNF